MAQYSSESCNLSENSLVGVTSHQVSQNSLQSQKDTTKYCLKSSMVSNDSELLCGISQL